MKKLALALVIAAIAASPAAAAKKKAKKAAAEPTNVAAQPQSPNQNTANFVRDSLPVFLPSWSMPLYMSVSGRKE